ncbi:MAG: YbjQ family protein [Candidatus Thermoplasmatota archaeon]|nr:YbjQ family protein [Candidatus Thermoplasmatota archaeon]
MKKKIPISNLDYVPGMEIKESLGLVRANVVRAKHVGKDIVAGLKNIVGGEVHEYTEMLSESREIALDRMRKKAEELDADAVINVRFMTSAIAGGSAEIMAYGTAVKLKNK